MALVHNVIIRGLNSIYLQARGVAPFKIKSVTPDNQPAVQLRDDFVEYCTIWAEFLHAHHHGEEEFLFPEVERIIGVPGIMEPNVNQHEAFKPGLDEFDAYLKRVSGKSYKPAERVGEDKFLYGEELCRIIDSFGEILVQHLQEEIPTLLALEKFGDRLPIAELFEKEGKLVMSKVKMSTVLVFFVVCYDMEFEGGMHKHFPEAPAIIMFLCRYILPWFNRRLWKFAPCTPMGVLKELPYASV